MNPRFPPRGTPEYYEFLEQWFLKERVDNERQWKALRQIVGGVAGLNPVMSIVSIGFPRGSGSGSGSPGCGTCSTIFVKLQYIGDTTYALNGSPCDWEDVTGVVRLYQTGDTVFVEFSDQVWTRSVSEFGNACTVGGGFTLFSNAGTSAVPVSVTITEVI